MQGKVSFPGLHGSVQPASVQGLWEGGYRHLGHACACTHMEHRHPERVYTHIHNLGIWDTHTRTESWCHDGSGLWHGGTCPVAKQWLDGCFGSTWDSSAAWGVQGAPWEVCERPRYLLGSAHVGKLRAPQQGPMCSASS